MKDDVISRQAAIDALLELYEYQASLDPTEAADLVRQGVYLAEKKIEKLPSAQPEQRWIPCSERLPEKCGVYLVSDGNKVWLCEWVHIVMVHGWNNDVRNPMIIAWMPRPEPWKGEQP